MSTEPTLTKIAIRALVATTVSTLANQLLNRAINKLFSPKEAQSKVVDGVEILVGEDTGMFHNTSRQSTEETVSPSVSIPEDAVPISEIDSKIDELNLHDRFGYGAAEDISSLNEAIFKYRSDDAVYAHFKAVDGSLESGHQIEVDIIKNGESIDVIFLDSTNTIDDD